MADKIAAFDFDGTLTPDGTNIYGGAKELAQGFRERGYRVVIWSARKTEAERQQMKAVLDAHSVPYDEIWPVKPEFDVLIDDKAIRVGCDDCEHVAIEKAYRG